MSEAVKVEVGLGDRAYDILIGSGLLARSGEEITRRLPGTRAAIVTDENVAAAHLDTLKAGLQKGGIGEEILDFIAHGADGAAGPFGGGRVLDFAKGAADLFQ